MVVGTGYEWGTIGARQRELGRKCTVPQPPMAVQGATPLFTDNAKRKAAKKKRCRSKSLVKARKRRQKQQHLQGLAEPSQPPTRSTTTQSSATVVSLWEQYLWTQNCFGMTHGEFKHYLLPSLRRSLPLCIRLRSMDDENNNGLLLRRQWFFVELQKAGRVHQGFLPGSWQIDIHGIHRDSSPLSDALSSLHRWIQNNASAVSRQETVSQIPVYLLDIQPHHAVLDLCASPGSKTLQAMDVISDKGFVVANEVDAKRAYTLVHRCRTSARSHECMQRLVVISHDACKLPNVLAPLCRQHTSGTTTSPSPYHRIICDVPCSGDGTLRKDTKVWKTWHPSYGIELHSLQLRIAKRGISLLQINEYMTYSTCSFHPVENEAVVAALLKTGTVQVVNVSDRMAAASLPYREGLTKWKVLDDELNEIDAAKMGKLYPKSLWPPTDDDHSIRQQLCRCVRMVPHDSDTGGFFIALLQKIAEYPVKDSSKKSKAAERAANAKRVTPKSEQHTLRPCSKTQSKNAIVTVRRGKRHTFELSDALADHILNAPGSDKLNIVYAGHKTKIAD